MAQLTGQGIRLRADERARSSLIDAYTNATPQGWARADTQFEIGLASGGALVDVSNLSSVTLEGSPFTDKDGARLFAKTIGGANLDNALTEATWQNGSAQHALFAFSNAEMNILPTPADRDVWLVITAVTNTGKQVVCGTGKMTFKDDGAFEDAPSPPVNPGSAITLGDADARYARNLFGVSTRTGGDATALSHVPTVGDSLGQLFSFTEASSGNLVCFRLVAGAAAAGNADQVAPVDYDAATNDVHFRLEPTGALVAPPYPPAADVDTIAARNAAITAALAGLGSGYTLTSVAANADKLSQTGIAAGTYTQITGEDGRIEQFLGPAAGEAGAGLRLTGAGFAGENNAYAPDGGNAFYNVDRVDDSTVVLGLDNTGQPAWVITDGGSTVHYYGTPTTHPWQAVWRVAPGREAPPPTVTRDDVAAEANWLVLRPTAPLVHLSGQFAVATLVYDPVNPVVNIDFQAAPKQFLAVAGNVTLQGTNMVAGASVSLRITASGGDRTVAYPAWRAFGAALPTTIPSGKTLRITLDAGDVTDASVDAAAVLSVV